MRLFFILLVVWKFPHALPYAGQPAPNGLAHWIDFSFLGHDPVVLWVRMALVLLSVPYVLGRWLPVVLPVITALHVAALTFFNSQGFINHSLQILGMVLVAQTLVVLFFEGWKLFSKRPFPFSPRINVDSYWVFFSQGAIVVSYVTSAVSKFINSEGMWLWNTKNIPIALVRTRMQEYYSHPAASAPPAEPPLASWLVEHPGAAPWLFGPGLFFELFAFFGLWNRAFSFWTGVILIGMHRMIAEIMQLHFEMHEWALLIFFVNVPWWLWWAWRRRFPTGDPT
ncbi:MAG: hypothetical protein ACR2OZ_06840 [Verrucomicrobiales bacterium]